MTDAGEPERGHSDEHEPQEEIPPSEDDAGPEGPSPEEVGCTVALPIETSPCEPDADFCDAVGDIDRGAPTDFTEAWSRQEPGLFVAQVRFAAPPFTGPTQTLSIWLRVSGDERDSSIACRDLPQDPDENATEVFVVDRVFAYMPEDVAIRFSVSGATPDLHLDVCETLFVSEDQRILEARIPVSGTVEGWWIQSHDADKCDEPDGSSSRQYLTSRSGTFNAATFTSICSHSCPASGVLAN